MINKPTPTPRKKSTKFGLFKRNSSKSRESSAKTKVTKTKVTKDNNQNVDFISYKKKTTQLTPKVAISEIEYRPESFKEVRESVEEKESRENLDESDFGSIRQLKLNKITIPMGKGVPDIEINREVFVKEYSFKVFDYLRTLDGIDN